MRKHSSTLAVKKARAIFTRPQFVNRQPVGIRLGSAGIHVGPEKLEISKGRFTDIPEEAEWLSLDGNPFTVAFDKKEGSPFADIGFEVPAGGCVTSGPIVNKAGLYRYTVYTRDGRHQKDPAILVTN